jgi:hypothetical protein
MERITPPRAPLADAGLHTKAEIIEATRVNNYMDARTAGIPVAHSGLSPDLQRGIDIILSSADMVAVDPELGRRLELRIENELARRKPVEIRIVKPEGR